MSISRIGGLIVLGQTDQAKAEIIEAFVWAQGDRNKAAEKLGCSVRSLYNWLNEIPGAWDELDDELERNDIARPAGPPRYRDKIVEAFVSGKGSIKIAAKELGVPEKKLVEDVARLGLVKAVNEGLRRFGIPKTQHLTEGRLRRAA